MCVPERVDPRRVVELADFDEIGEAERSMGHSERWLAQRDKRHGQERHERPQRVAGIGGDKLWQHSGEAARGEARGMTMQPARK